MTDGPTLSRASLRASIARDRGIEVPSPELLDLPERAMQFGTGALLRGLVDYFIDEANRQGQFGGRVMMIGSTGSGRDRRLNEQDGLYTLVGQGIAERAARRHFRVSASVRRARRAATARVRVLRG